MATSKIKLIVAGTLGAIATTVAGLAFNYHSRTLVSSIFNVPTGFVLAILIFRNVRKSFGKKPLGQIGLVITMLIGWLIAWDYVGNNRVSEYMSRQVLARYQSDELKYCCVSIIFGIVYMLVLPSSYFTATKVRDCAE